VKFLWISQFMDTLPLQMKVAEEGNEVEVCCLDPKRSICGEGMVQKVKDWRKVLEKDKIVVFDMIGNGRDANALKKQGYSVFGGHPLADQLELDRMFGDQAMRTAGIKTPKSTYFTDFDEAIAFVEKTGQNYVFKPSGNMVCAYTYVSYNANDMIQFLKEMRPQHKRIEFQLQQVIDGVECSVEGLFNGSDWVDGWFNVTLERKRASNNDLGQNTGCAMDVVKVLPLQRESPIVKKTLMKITPLLRASDYRGLIDLNAMYYNGTPLGLEWTPRFGINAIYTMCELLKDDIGKVIAETALGQNTEVNTEKSLFGASVRTFLPGKNIVPHRLVQNLKSFNHIWPMDMMLNNEGNLVSCDTDFLLNIVTASGPTIKEASSNVYRTLNKADNFGIRDIMYRTDCGDHASKAYEQMLRWGLL